jgi:hypothetical protein
MSAFGNVIPALAQKEFLPEHPVSVHFAGRIAIKSANCPVFLRALS